jgi:3-oxoacyl-[acyl-carrier protein] reductase
MDIGLGGKFALVKGGSMGIGKGAAMALAAQGCNIAIYARDEEVIVRAPSSRDDINRRLA